MLSERRIQQLRRRTLTAAEFIPFMSKIDPIYREEEEAYKVCIQTYSTSTHKHTHGSTHARSLHTHSYAHIHSHHIHNHVF